VIKLRDHDSVSIIAPKPASQYLRDTSIKLLLRDSAIFIGLCNGVNIAGVLDASLLDIIEARGTITTL